MAIGRLKRAAEESELKQAGKCNRFNQALLQQHCCGTAMVLLQWLLPRPCMVISRLKGCREE
jgi:hypothetical protein